MKFKKNKTILIAAITVLSLIVPCEAQVIENNSNFISTGHAELDKLRKEVKLYPTNSNNVAQRRSSIDYGDYYGDKVSICLLSILLLII